MRGCVGVFPLTSAPTAPKPEEENLGFCFQDPYLTSSEPVEAIPYFICTNHPKLQNGFKGAPGLWKSDIFAPRIQLLMS